MAAPRRPLGLFLSGGGALGAWQAAVLDELRRAGLSFDKVMGFSIGAFNAAALAFGRFADALARWETLDGGVIKLRPRLRPHLSLFSDAPLRELLDVAKDEEDAKTRLSVPLCVIAAAAAEGTAVYAEFVPGGRWHGPLEAWLRATAAIPGAFPPVRIGGKTYVDGGVPMPAPLHFDFFAECAEVWVLEMVRQDELARRPWNPFYGLDQGGRVSARRLIDEGVSSLMTRAAPPLVRRLCPSRRLEPVMLDFRARSIRPMLELGRRDARAFLETLE